MIMILVVGLGNPGKKYDKTRHNLGYEVIDELKKSVNRKAQNAKVIMVKPDIFMNESGKAVKKLISNFQIPISNLWVVHDDIDLKLGDLRIIQNRDSAGHKGVASIIKELGTKNFFRFRLGINPNMTKRAYKDLDEFVVEKFLPAEKKIIKNLIEKTKEAIIFALENGVPKAMNIYNKKIP